MDLGSTIKELRKYRGAKQVEAAKGIGISQTYLSQIEAGKKKASMDVLENISNYLQIPCPVLCFLSITREDVPEEKRETFDILRPGINSLLLELFKNKFEIK